MEKGKSVKVAEVEWEVAKRLALKHRVSLKTVVGMAIQLFAARDDQSTRTPVSTGPDGFSVNAHGQRLHWDAHELRYEPDPD